VREREQEYRTAKRMFDKCVATLLLVLLAPLAAVALAAIGIDMLLRPADRGRLLYRERRISRGREFDLLKFRVLREDVLERIEPGAYARPYEAEPAALTWAGRRVLKPFYLDELPQVLNVLAGEISLVGPRPWPPAAVEEQRRQGLDYRDRIVAGWTGSSQVAKGQGETGPMLDLAYVDASRTWGASRLLRHDLALLARTVAVMTRGGGLGD
jgi:lipopolysaccharide/colanic/teichoic acid biosynthesis glycosyltransferase